MPVRDAEELLLPDVTASLAALDLKPEHDAAVKLARRYAAAIDNARDESWALRWIGPLLLDCLESLGATPASRKAGSDDKPAGQSKLAALRKAHTA